MNETPNVDMELLRSTVKAKRKRSGHSLRVSASKIGISAPTLQRIEAGQLPTMQTLLKVADWLGMGIDDLRGAQERGGKNTVAQIEVFLRADPHLDQDSATAIANIVREVYHGFKKKQETE